MTKEPSGTAIAFIGLGMMGLPMAKRLVASGYDVTGFDLSENARSEFAAAGGKVAASVADACAGKDFAITMLPNERIVRDALMGDGGGAFSLPRGAVVIDMSSSAPSGTIELAKQLDAMANDAEHPNASKAISLIAPSRTRAVSRIWSPHTGLPTNAAMSGDDTRPQLRGLVK